MYHVFTTNLWKSIEQFLSDPANKLTNAEENATSSMEVKMQFNQLYTQLERYQSLSQRSWCRDRRDSDGLNGLIWQTDKQAAFYGSPVAISDTSVGLYYTPCPQKNNLKVSSTITSKIVNEFPSNLARSIVDQCTVWHENYSLRLMYVGTLPCKVMGVEIVTKQCNFTLLL